jgi:hypothetical protein
VIEVEMSLKSAISSARDANLCRIVIINDGTGSTSKGNYDVELYARNNGRLVRSGRVEEWPRNAKPAWRLLGAALDALEASQ